MAKKKGFLGKLKNKFSGKKKHNFNDETVNDQSSQEEIQNIETDFSDNLYIPVGPSQSKNESDHAQDEDATVVLERPDFQPPPEDLQEKLEHTPADQDATVVLERPGFQAPPPEDLQEPLEHVPADPEQDNDAIIDETGPPQFPDEMPLTELAAQLTKGQKTKNILLKSSQKISGIFRKIDGESSQDFLKKLGDKSSNIFDKNLWDKWLDEIFSAKNRPFIHRIFILIVCLGFSYTVGKLLGLALQPPIKGIKSANIAGYTNMKFGKDLLNDIETIKLANLFNAKESHEIEKKSNDQPVVKIDKNLVCHQAEKSSKLPLTLQHTIVLQDSVKSLASVQKKGKQDIISVREGDRIGDIAEIGRINRLNMIVKNLNSGECEYIQNIDTKFEKKHRNKALNIVSPEAGKKLISAKRPDGITNNGDNFKIKKSYRKKMLGNMSEILTQARGIPIRNPDGSYSFKIEDIVQGSIYSHLSMQNGDIIKGINGKKIANMNEVMTMFGKLNSIDQMSLTIIRNGSEKTMDYEFE